VESRSASVKPKPHAGKDATAQRKKWLPGRHLAWALLLAVSVGALGALLVPPHFALLTRILIGWDIGLIVLLVAQWLIIGLSSPKHVEQQAAVDDPGNLFILMVSIGVSMFGLFGAVFMLDRPDPAMMAFASWAIMAVVFVAVVGGWLELQTTYTLHYARLYYANEEGPGGLVFAGEPPHDMDFAYFAFTVGMTFQVSDIAVTTRAMRRVVLAQSLVSFVYNLVVIALLINIVAGRV
jgi:uncharacterized membrane protein